jgi:hypothetical protein
MESTSSDGGVEKPVTVPLEAQEESNAEQSGSHIGATAEHWDGTSVFSFIKSRLQPSPPLSIRIGCLLFVLWAVNLAWALRTPFI